MVLESVASEVLVDRRGQVEGFTQEILAFAGCSTIACLRTKPLATLRAANSQSINNVTLGAFKPGPAADGA